MATTQPELTPELQRALDESGGMYRGSSFVLLTVEQYERLRDVDEDLVRSADALKRAMSQVKSGQTFTLEEVDRRLGEKFGV